MNKTVYIVIEGGCVIDALSNMEDIDVVILDKDTQDEEMLNQVNSTLKEVLNDPDVKEVEIY